MSFLSSITHVFTTKRARSTSCQLTGFFFFLNTIFVFFMYFMRVCVLLQLASLRFINTDSCCLLGTTHACRSFISILEGEILKIFIIFLCFFLKLELPNRLKKSMLTVICLKFRKETTIPILKVLRGKNNVWKKKQQG